MEIEVGIFLAGAIKTWAIAFGVVGVAWAIAWMMRGHKNDSE